MSDDMNDVPGQGPSAASAVEAAIPPVEPAVVPSGTPAAAPTEAPGAAAPARRHPWPLVAGIAVGALLLATIGAHLTFGLVRAMHGGGFRQGYAAGAPGHFGGRFPHGFRERRLDGHGSRDHDFEGGRRGSGRV